MKRINSIRGNQTKLPVQNEDVSFHTKSRFSLLTNRFQNNKYYYYGLCLLMLIVIGQSACKKKDTEVVPVVTISAINKNILHIGDTLVITGANFNNTPSKNLVSVAAVAYSVIKSSPTQLSVIVPQDAQGGTLSIGFDGGQSTSFSQLITIVGSTQPFIKSISPVSAYENDTISIKGGNFGVPYTTNSVTFGGTAGKVINVSDSVIRVIVPLLGVSGPLVITTKGLNSLPVQFTVSKVDPNTDGSICWMNLNYGSNDEYNQVQTEAIFDKGVTNATLPESTTLYDYKQALTPGDDVDYFYYPNYYPQLVTADNFIVNDAQNNAYYLTGTNYSVPTQYSLMKVNTAGGKPVTVCTQSFPAPGTSTDYVSAPGSYPVTINDLPITQISMDNNTVYVKIGVSDNYYTCDVSATTPTFTLKQNVFGDQAAFKPQFGTNYIFYEEMGPSSAYDNAPDAITGIRYMPRGSKTSIPVPLTLQAGEQIVSMQADVAHGDNLLIFTTAYDATYTYYNTIYKFNAATKQLTTLYSPSNWTDAKAKAPGVQNPNTGFLWAGTHIYYSTPSASSTFSSLSRLNDNGITPKIYIIYGRMETNSQARASLFYLFLGK